MAELHLQAERDYMLGMKYKDIAEKYKVAINTVKSWKQRHGWKKANKKDAPKEVHTNKVCKRVQDAPTVILKENEELTEKQKLFCLFYVKSFNGTMSAIKAGYAKNTAHVEASRLLRNAKIADEIKRIKGDAAENLFISATDVLSQYAKIAFADMGDYMTFGQKEVPVIGMFGPIKDEAGKEVTQIVNYVDMAQSDNVDTSLLTEVKKGKDGISIKLADKMKALEKLEQYVDLLPDHWKRELEKEKLDIERKKLAIIENKDKAPDKPSVQPYIDALTGIIGDVWDDEAGK